MGQVDDGGPLRCAEALPHEAAVGDRGVHEPTQVGDEALGEDQPGHAHLAVYEVRIVPQAVP